MKSKTPEAFLPLPPARYYIMSSLLSPRHAYAIIDNVERMTDGRIALSVPTLYENLKRLKADGLIEPAGEVTKSNGEIRRLLRLSGLGRSVLGAEEESRRRFARENRRALRGVGHAF